MRPASRRQVRQRRRALPPRSRLTVRRAVAALRSGREAISDLERQLAGLLELLHHPHRIDAAVPERLAGTVREAGVALASLADIRRLLPTA